jgi:hypothetical protein
LEYSKYVHKSDVLQLPGLVLQEYVRFQNEKSKTNKFERAYLFSVRHWFGLRGSTEFWLESFLTEDENHIVPDSWKIADQINSGEKKQIKEKVELSSELKFEQNLETEISANAEVAWEAVGKIKTKLGAVLKEKVAASSVLKEGITKESIREITLPEEPKNPSELHVRSRGFYWAPVHRKIQCHISKIMWPMNERNSLSITVLQPTGRVATKQKDILSDGTTREIFTGVHGI